MLQSYSNAVIQICLPWKYLISYSEERYSHMDNLCCLTCLNWYQAFLYRQKSNFRKKHVGIICEHVASVNYYFH